MYKCAGLNFQDNGNSNKKFFIQKEDDCFLHLFYCFDRWNDYIDQDCRLADCSNYFFFNNWNLKKCKMYDQSLTEGTKTYSRSNIQYNSKLVVLKN